MDNFLYLEKDGEYIIKIDGRATMKNAKILSDFIDEKFNDMVGLSFEMSDLSYMDSTFLGLIAKYAVDFKVNKNKNLLVINPSLEAKEFLKQTGIDKFIDIILKEDIEEINNKVSGKDFDNMNNKAKYILEMHEVLMNLNEENKNIFQPVVEQMRKVIK